VIRAASGSAWYCALIGSWISRSVMRSSTAAPEPVGPG
jgi:hypothetical protein